MRRLGREQGDERQPVLDAAEDRRGADHEGKDRRPGQAKLEQPQRRDRPVREVPEKSDTCGGKQGDLRQRQHEREQDERVEDRKGRRPQLAAEVVPGVVDVVGVERDPLGEVPQGLVPQERPGREQHHGS